MTSVYFIVQDHGLEKVSLYVPHDGRVGCPRNRPTFLISNLLNLSSCAALKPTL